MTLEPSFSINLPTTAGKLWFCYILFFFFLITLALSVFDQQIGFTLELCCDSFNVAAPFGPILFLFSESKSTASAGYTLGKLTLFHKLKLIISP